jgi:pimeloyl-ACP methyl ester carboxylesterase
MVPCSPVVVVDQEGVNMRKHEQTESAPPPRRRGRGCLVWLGGTAAVLLGLALLGAGYESVSEASDARADAPPGRMVDVGGHRLHIDCVGAGSPTVVIDYGWGDSAASWSRRVQPDAAKTTRVCTYDRAGTGYSEAGPLPRTAERFADELHTLLQRADVPGPYVMVGHSLGGAHVRVFAHAYPAEVAGVVLIESMSPKAATPSDPVAPPGTNPRSGGDWFLTLPARIGVLRLLAGPLDLDPLSVSPRSVQATIDEGRGIPEGLAQAGAVASLGATPLIVLSSGQDHDADSQGKQTKLLQLSSNSQQLFAERSGHNVQFDQPEAAVGAIVQMVDRVRRATP